MVCDNLKGKRALLFSLPRVGPGAFLWARLDQHNLCANNWIMYKLLQFLHMENLSSWFSSFIIHIARWAWAREDFWTYVCQTQSEIGSGYGGEGYEEIMMV